MPAMAEPGTTAADRRRRAELLGLQADKVRRDLGIDEVLGSMGTVHLVGSAAHDLMVWPDLDLTVVCDRLDVRSLYLAGADLVTHSAVRKLTVRNDTGHWNTDPEAYPDGVYWGVDYREEASESGVGGQAWNIDIWFVDEEDRQPDLQHVASIARRLTDETRDAILAIKGELAGTAEYGTTIRSYDIYQAVLDRGVRTLEEFQAHHRPTVS